MTLMQVTYIDYPWDADLPMDPEDENLDTHNFTVEEETEAKALLEILDMLGYIRKKDLADNVKLTVDELLRISGLTAGANGDEKDFILFIENLDNGKYILDNQKDLNRWLAPFIGGDRR